MTKDESFICLGGVICPECDAHVDYDDLDNNDGYCTVCGLQLCTYRHTKEKVMLT